MKKAIVAVVLALTLSANAEPVKLLPGDACPDVRPALFLPSADAVRIAGELAAARAERDALAQSQSRMRNTAIAALVGAALATIAAGAAVAVVKSESAKK